MCSTTLNNLIVIFIALPFSFHPNMDSTYPAIYCLCEGAVLVALLNTCVCARPRRSDIYSHYNCMKLCQNKLVT